MSEDAVILLLVVAVMVMLPVAAVWWSCKVAPPTKVRGLTIAELMRTAAMYADDMRKTWERVQRTGQATADDIHQLGEALRRNT